MTLIVLAILAAALVALNCFYNLTGFLCCVLPGFEDRYVKDDVSKLSVRRYQEENSLFDDSDFDE